MKRILITLIGLLVVSAVLFTVYLRSSSFYQSINYVPEEADIIIQIDDPVKAWENFIQSNIWTHYKTHSLLRDVGEQLASYDSLVNSSKWLTNVLGQKSIMMAKLPVDENDFDFIYILNVGKAANLKHPEKVLRSILSVNYKINSRDYLGRKIIEILDTEESLYYFLCFENGKILFSFNPNLVEKSINASENSIIGKDLHYLQVASHIENKGLIKLIIKHNNFWSYFSGLSAETEANVLDIMENLFYTGITFDITSEDLIVVESYTSYTDSLEQKGINAFGNGSQLLKTMGVIPNRVASLFKINFDDFSELIGSTMKLGGDVEYREYEESISKLEKKLKVDIHEVLFSWMDSEMVLLQTQPSNLGRDNEFAVVINAKDSLLALNNLKILWKQIKKNTPVKIKSVNYRGYAIDYVAFPGIIKTLFGKALNKIEKPYFTVISDYVVVSNHPQTSKNIIDDYLSGKTLSKEYDFFDFNKNFENTTSTFVYFEPPVLYHNLKSFVDRETWVKIKELKTYITCFSQGGFQIRKEKNTLQSSFKLKYNPQNSNWTTLNYNTLEITSLFNRDNEIEDDETESSPIIDTIPDITIANLDAKKHEEFYDDQSVKLFVEIKNGLKHGDFKAYHVNGKLKIRGQFKQDKPIGKWKYYSITGDLVKTDRY